MRSNQHIHYRDNVARYFFDTEFMEDGKTVELLSIGIVCAAAGSTATLGKSPSR